MSLGRMELEHLADDYVLGLLSETEADLLEEILVRDEALARRVGELRDRMLPLDLSAPPARMPDGFAERLRERITAEPKGEVTPLSVRRPSPTRIPLRLVAASVAGLVLGFGAGWLRPQPEPTVIAVLVDDNGVPQAIVEDFGNDTATVRFVAPVDLPADRILQAWTLPPTDAGPTSLGLIEVPGPTTLQGPDLPPPRADQLYEITVEPLGGSPTGRPTGPILGKGYAVPQRL